MAFSQTSSPTAAAETNNVLGSLSWTNVDNAKVDDGSYATASTTGSTGTEYLEVTDFDFSIPSTGTVIGIEVNVQAKVNTVSGGSGVGSMTVFPIMSGDSGDAETHIFEDTNEYVWTSGGPTDLQGISPTPSQVNASAFGTRIWHSGVSANRTYSIDYVTMTVYYTDYGHSGVSVAYTGGWTRTGIGNTPFEVRFTGNSEVTRWDLRTAASGGGTLIASGSATSGSNAKEVAYNASGLGVGDFTYYVRTGNDDAYSSSTSVTIKNTGANYVEIPGGYSHTADPVPTTKQYTVSFTPQEQYSPATNAIAYQIRTLSGGGGTLLASGNATHNSAKTTATITDTALVDGDNTRYLRVTNSSNNIKDHTLIIEANIITQSNSGSMSLSGNVSRVVSKSFAGTPALTGEVNKQTSKFFSGTMGALTGAVTSVIVQIKSVTGTISTSTGTLGRVTLKALSGAISPTGAMTIQGRILRLSGSLTGLTGSGGGFRVQIVTLSGAISSLSGAASSYLDRHKYAIMKAGNAIRRIIKGGSA